MNEITKREIPAGKKPMSVAAAVLYMSCEISGEHKSQSEIANAAGISSITLRNRFLELQSKIRRKLKEGPTGPLGCLSQCYESAYDERQVQDTSSKIL